MNSKKIKTIEDGFILAATNQKTFDALYYKISNHNINDFYGIPRPAVWIKKSEAFRSLIKILSKPLAYFWCYFFFYPYILYKLVTLIAQRKTTPPVTLESKIIAYAINEHSCKTLTKATTQTNNIIWLAPSNAEISNATRLKLNIVEPTSILKIKDILPLVKLCPIIHKRIVKKHGKEFAWQNYALLDWMLIHETTVKLSPKIIMTAEHHDRWAVLADIYCSQSRSSPTPCTIELTQHGNEYEQTYTLLKEITGQSSPPYRLQNLSKINVYNHEQLTIFKQHILDPHHPAIKAGFIQNSLTLTQIPNDSTSILFIGHPFCEEFQKELYTGLKHIKNINIYYKPHPAAKSSRNIQKNDWNYIKDRNFYPLVDFAISYPSTLADQYKSEGVDVITHPLEAKLENAEAYLKTITNLINLQKKENENKKNAGII